ncbi:hypothetical protein, partial [Caballeronia sp. ATUFL_F2_KS42]|uniref:hypothetical protein n=1 Tax=Caballeronia sp. ATUFL_F2_KS42 TaxID=2921765 RepID=UPI002027EED8
NRCKTIDRFSRNSPLEIDRHDAAHTPLLTLAQFDVTMPILEEIKETLAEYFLDNPRIGVAPLDRAFIEQRGSRRFIDVFEMNGGEAWGVEAVLWSDGKPQEPILQVEIQRDHAQMRLRYKYIGS